MLIREERPVDRAAVYTLNTAAFGQPAEADLVDRLRDAAQPLISLVAEDDGAIVGHIMFTPVTLAGYDERLMGLAPMAVVPGRQRSGIGSALVRAGLDACARLGAAAVVVLGHPEFYPRFGFSPAADFGIASEYDAPREAFMAIELRPGSLQRASGTISYHPAFSGL